MKVTRIINNNVVAAVDDYNQELVLMGSGIGFKKKIGCLLYTSCRESGKCWSVKTDIFILDMKRLICTAILKRILLYLQKWALSATGCLLHGPGFIQMDLMKNPMKKA